MVRSLYAAGASSLTSSFVSQTIPSMDLTKSSCKEPMVTRRFVNERRHVAVTERWQLTCKMFAFAFVLDIFLPAPWLQELQLKGFAFALDNVRADTYKTELDITQRNTRT